MMLVGVPFSMLMYYNKYIMKQGLLEVDSSAILELVGLSSLLCPMAMSFF